MELLKRDTDYAVRALVAIASGDGFVQASNIAVKQQIPYDFIQKILRKLRGAGILKTRRGSTGGFALAKPAANISLLSVVHAVQGPLAVNRCFLGEDKCPVQKTCPVRCRLEHVQAGICELLEEISLAELVEEKTRPGEAGRGK